MTKKMKVILSSAIFIGVSTIMFWFFYWNTGERKVERYLRNGTDKIKNLTYDLTNEDELVVVYCLRPFCFEEKNSKEVITLKEISNAATDFIKVKKYNQNLYFHFIVSNFDQNNELTQYAVETFMEKEKENSLPYYLAAIYYYKQNNLERAKTVFLTANDLKKIDLFEVEMRALLNKIIIQKTKDPMLPAMMWIGIVRVELMMSLRRDIGELIQRQEGLNVAMHRTLGEKLYNASSTVMGKMIGIALRRQGIDKESLEFKILNNELKNLGKDQPDSQNKDLDILKEYLLDMIKVGEVQALKNLSAKEAAENLIKQPSQLK